MAEAKVESIESLKSLKVALIKFAEDANVALADADSEVGRTMQWLQLEQTSYWQMQHRKRTDIIARCQEAVRAKKLFKDSSGRQQSAIEEEKALQIALRKLEEAVQKIAAVRKAIKVMEKEIPLYKGSVQRFATTVQVDVPAAAAKLESLLDSLDAYVSYAAPEAATSSAPQSGEPALAGGDFTSMARPADQIQDKEKPEPEETQKKPEAGA